VSEQNKQVVIDFIEAFSRADAAACEPLLAPDAITIAKGFGQISGLRTREFMLETTKAFKDVVPTGLRPSFKNVIAEGDGVAVEWEGDGVLANGERYANQYCMVFKLENGKIKTVHEYFCTVLADSKIGPLLGGVETARKQAEA
jgi:ketosteroid isomerase-like protein